MNKQEKISHLQSLLDLVDEQTYENKDAWDKAQKRIAMVIGNVLGEPNKYNQNFKNISYVSGVFVMGNDYWNDQKDREVWNEGIKKLKNLLTTIKEEIEEFGIDTSEISKKNNHNNILSNKIFIVHGHDENFKNEVSEVLKKLKLEPVILHEQPDQGRTIIEKFEDHSEKVGFAVILISPDDYGYSKKDGETWKKLRPRQNVIFELGYFSGKLGRKRVMTIVKKGNEEIELLSDFSGVLYTPYNESWQFKLCKELKEAGYNLDINNLL